MPEKSLAILKLTTLWAFSESVLGGILHALGIPFRGAVLAGFAVILISMIALFSDKRGEIFKATLIVILVKGAVSPHTPVTAYFAVFLQGVLGELFFFSKKFFKTSALLLAVISVILSSAQRIITLTIVYGNSLWDSIDVYSNFVLKQVFYSGTTNKSFQISLAIILIYTSIHFLFGVYVGFVAGRLPGWINQNIKSFDVTKLKTNFKSNLNSKPGKKKGVWWKRKSRIYLFVVLIFLIGFSYLHPELEDIYGLNLLIMIFRAIIILYLWFTFLSPVIYKSLKKYLDKKKSTYAEQVSTIIDSIPYFKFIFELVWFNSSGEKYTKRIKKFFTLLIILSLLPEEAVSSIIYKEL